MSNVECGIGRHLLLIFLIARSALLITPWLYYIKMNPNNQNLV